MWARFVVVILTPPPQKNSPRGPFQPAPVAKLAQKASALTLAGLMAVAPVAPALAGEFDVFADDLPSGYLIDDAGVLNAVTKGEVNKELKVVEEKTGYKMVVITLRKLDFTPDPFTFSDKMLEKWFPTAEQGDKRGVLLVVTSGKEGALSGGKSFLSQVGDGVFDGVLGDNIPILTEEEKYNEAVTSSVRRIGAALEGKDDIGGPVRKDNKRVRTYKTKDETKKGKLAYSTVVLTLLFIAFVVPMLQFYGYVAKD